MATYTQYKETVTRVIWEVPTPAAFVEIEKAISSAFQYLKSRDGYASVSDNAIMVETGDDFVKVVVLEVENS